jgi:hypothetical protein
MESQHADFPLHAEWFPLHYVLLMKYGISLLQLST